MACLPDVARARLLVENYRAWFGGPVIRLGGKVVDGNKRLAAWRALQMTGSVPTLVAKDARDAARLVLLAGHVERAAQMLGDSIPYDINTATTLRVPPEVGAALVAYQRKRNRPPARRSRKRADVVSKVQTLYLRSVEGECVRPEDLLDALGDWA